MILDVGPILRGEISKMSIDYALEPEPMPDVVFSDTATVQGVLTDDAGYMRLSLCATVPYETECARCLSPVKGTFSIRFDRTAVTEGTLSEKELEENADEYVIIKNRSLDVDEQLREALILSIPMRFLCSEDCPGLCPKCGKPLREGKCGCPEKDPDPRWDALRKFRTE